MNLSVISVVLCFAQGVGNIPKLLPTILPNSFVSHVLAKRPVFVQDISIMKLAKHVRRSSVCTKTENLPAILMKNQIVDRNVRT